MTVRESDILDLIDRLVAACAPEKVVLFGSHAYGAPRPDSDVDLLVVMPFDGKSRDKALKLWSLLRPRVPVDLLVRRPEDVARRYEQWDPLIREALDKGKVLYERHGAGVAGQVGGRLARRPARAGG